MLQVLKANTMLAQRKRRNMRQQGTQSKLPKSFLFLNPDGTTPVTLMAVPNTQKRPQVYSVEVLDSEADSTVIIQGRERT